MDFYIGEEEAYLEEADKGTLPVYHYEHRGPSATVEIEQEEASHPA